MVLRNHFLSLDERNLVLPNGSDSVYMYMLDF